LKIIIVGFLCSFENFVSSSQFGRGNSSDQPFGGPNPDKTDIIIIYLHTVLSLNEKARILYWAGQLLKIH
jgi:hypothetical protein